MDIRLLVQMSMPEAPAQPENSLEDKIRYMLDCIDSGYDSSVEWIALQKFYKGLQKAKQTSKVRNLMRMIEPVMAKYGQQVGKAGID